MTCFKAALITLLLARAAGASPIQKRDHSIEITSSFEDLLSDKFRAAPELGSYTYSGYYPRRLPAITNPYNYLNWGGLTVMNNCSDTDPGISGGIGIAPPIIIPAGNSENTAVGYQEEAHNISMSTGPTDAIDRFTLKSTYVACFIDINGPPGYYGDYYDDNKIAVDCLLNFTAKKVNSDTYVSQAFNYTGGCQQNIKTCQQIGRPMQQKTFSASMSGLSEVIVTLQKVYYHGTTDRNEGQGPNGPKKSEVMFALDDFSYVVYQNA